MLCGVAPHHSKSDDSHRAEARRHQSRSVLRSSSTPEPSGPLSPVEFIRNEFDCSPPGGMSTGGE